MSDYIEQLPMDETIPTQHEVKVLDRFFNQKAPLLKRIFQEVKDAIVIGLIFILFNLPFVDNMIKSVVKSSENSIYIFMGIKTLLFIVVFYLVKNLWIVRK